jgi:hypothetical protein
MPANRISIQTTAIFLFTGFAVASQAMDAYTIVPDGENAPESLVRIVTAKELGSVGVAVTAVQGPCRREAKAKTDFVIRTRQQIAKDDLFFKVPAPVGREGFSLRRATSDEVAMYERCRWQ